MAERKLVKQLWFWVLVAIALGIVVWLVAPGTAEKAKWLADAFIQLIKTVTGPVTVLIIWMKASASHFALSAGPGATSPNTMPRAIAMITQNHSCLTNLRSRMAS